MKLYCDVDGVLADFDNGTKRYTSKFSNNWEDLPPNFFSELDKLENSKEFVNTLKKMFKDNFYILTAIPKPHRGEISKRAKKDKINWLEKNFNIPRNKIIVVYREQKQNFANPNSILIDDTPVNVQEWNNQGGIGILFKNHNQAINQINSI